MSDAKSKDGAEAAVGVLGALSIGIGGIVGGGIFATLGLAVSDARGSAWLSFLVAGVVALLTAYSYSKLSVTFPSSGSYRVEYRVASPSGSTVSLDLNAGSIQLGQVAIPATGGWQNWTTVSQTVNINAGTYNVGVFAPAGGWNLNWVKFTKL